MILVHPRLWTADAMLWFPPAGVGLVLVAWLGWRGLVVALASVAAVHAISPAGAHSTPLVADVLLTALELSLAWWGYRGLAKGRRRISDPGSATAFLLIVPGAAVGVAALGRCLWSGSPISLSLSHNWISHAVGVLATAPPVLFVATPCLSRLGWIAADDDHEESPWLDPAERWLWGDGIEVLGLALGGVFLGVLVARSHLSGQTSHWHFWAILLLLVVWASLRQGLRGGAVTACSAAASALLASGAVNPAQTAVMSLQGNLLALASVALLVGASSGWIRAREMRYRQIIGHIPVVLYSARITQPGSSRQAADNGAGARAGTMPSAQIILASAACRRVLGCQPSELLGDYSRWLERVHPKDREVVNAAVAQLLLHNQVVTCEYRLNPAYLSDMPPSDSPRRTPTNMLRLSGLLLSPTAVAERWVRETLAPSYDKSGRLEGWEGVVEDITTPRRLAQDLQRTSNMLHALVANLPAGVFFVQGPNGQPVLVNARARQLLGQREDPSAGVMHLPRVYHLHRPDGSLYPWDELPVFQALHLGLTTMRDDIVIHRPDGRQIPLVTWAAPIQLGPAGNVEAAVWVFEDLTALKQAEAARLDSEARLRTVFQALGEGLVIQDAEGRIVDCNPAACAILGATEDQLLGQAFPGREAICVKEDNTPLPAEDQPDRVCLRTGKPVRNAILGLWAREDSERGERPSEDAVRWFLVNCVPLAVPPNPVAQAARLVTTFTDVTGLRRWEEEMEEVQRLELVGRLASGVVHDFNHLLTLIVSHSHLVRKKLTEDPETQENLQTIETTAAEAGRLASQLLSFSRQRKIELEPICLNDVVRRTLRILRGSLPKNVSLQLHLAERPLEVLADAGQLQQVVMNLCLNARDAMPRGGTLTIRTCRTLEQADGPSAVLSVEDTGDGIEPAIQAKIFEPFFSTKARGTGLGLAVARQIIESFQGHIDCVSEVARGTRFEIRLPLRPTVMHGPLPTVNGTSAAAGTVGPR